jgi:hypothetical protein
MLSVRSMRIFIRYLLCLAPADLPLCGCAERACGAELASLLKRVWDEVGDAIKKGAAVTVTDRAVRFRRLPIVGDRVGSNP